MPDADDLSLQQLAALLEFVLPRLFASAPCSNVVPGTGRCTAEVRPVPLFFPTAAKSLPLPLRRKWYPMQKAGLELLPRPQVFHSSQNSAKPHAWFVCCFAVGYQDRGGASSCAGVGRQSGANEAGEGCCGQLDAGEHRRQKDVNPRDARGSAAQIVR